MSTPFMLKDAFRLFGQYGLPGRYLVRLGSTKTSQFQLEQRKYSCPLNNAHFKTSQLQSKHFSSAPSIDSSTPLSPAVRYLVYTHSISDLSQLTPTGPGQRLLKGDVLKYIEDAKDGSVTQPIKPSPSKQNKPVPAKKRSTDVSHSSSGLAFTDKPVDSGRVAAAQRITRHKATTPYSYASVSCSLDAVSKLRYNGQDLTAFFVKATALTIQREPQSNCVWSGDSVTPLHSIDVSVLSDGRTIKVGGANNRSLAVIANAIKDGSSSSESSQSSCISIIHLEGGGVTHFTSILDPPQSSTLSIGSSQTVLNEQGSPSRRVTVTLTADTRVMDYELSCRWLETFSSIVEAPDSSGLL